MKDSSDQEFPAELRGIVSRLRGERASADPLMLDQIKGRVIRRAQKPQRGLGAMKARLATVFTLLVLAGGTGGALAIANSGGGGQAHSAASSQYKGHHGCKRHGHHYKKCPKPQKHHFHCRYKNHYYKNCPYGRHHKGVYAEYPHNFHCRYHGKHYNKCPYSEHMRGVHKTRH